MNLEITQSVSTNDLEGIRSLQRANLPGNLTQDEITREGFVTVRHSYEDLKNLHDIEPHVIAKDNDTVVAYLLAMTVASKADIPVLVPMFEVFNKSQYHEKPLSDYRYIVVGQVCVAKGYRGQGLLDKCYAHYRKVFEPHYEFAITEIDAKNLRSLKAHERVGFQELTRFTADTGVEWVIVIWDWRKS